MRRNKANDLQFLQIIQSPSGRTEGQEREYKCSQNEPGRRAFNAIAIHYSSNFTNSIKLSRIERATRGLAFSAANLSDNLSRWQSLVKRPPRPRCDRSHR